MAISKELLDILACPKCKGDIYLTDAGDGLICDNCKNSVHCDISHTGHMAASFFKARAALCLSPDYPVPLPIWACSPRCEAENPTSAR